MLFTLKFKNGDEVDVKDFDIMLPEGDKNNFFESLKLFKENDLPIEIGGENGNHYSGRTIDLVAIEIKLK